MKTAILLGLFLLGACAAPTETIYLAKGGERVQCGPYKDDMIMNTGGARGLQNKLRECVSDYQRSGYNRVSGHDGQ